MQVVINNDNINHLFLKIHILNPQEKSDFRFILEPKPGSSFAKTSDSIKTLIMNSENTSTTIINPSRSNKFPDVTSVINNFTYRVDIKAGDNKNHLAAFKENLFDIQLEQIQTTIGLDITKINEDNNMVNAFSVDTSNSGNQVLSIFLNINPRLLHIMFLVMIFK